MNNSAAEIGYRIKEGRLLYQMSQTELANRIGKTLRTVQKYESGEIVPSIAMIGKIADALSLPAEQIMGYQRNELHLETMADVLVVLNEINRKAGLHFDVQFEKSGDPRESVCALRFDPQDEDAEYNWLISSFMCHYQAQQYGLKNYEIDMQEFERWFEHQLSDFSNIPLKDREIKQLTWEERFEKQNELRQNYLKEQSKSEEESSDF